MATAKPVTYEYLQSRPQDTPGIPQPGGQVIECQSSFGGNLLIGDVVYFDTAAKVTKAASAASYQTFAGVVVGGRATGMQAVWNPGTAAGATIPAAANGQEVLVQITGVAWVQTGAGYGAGTGTVAGSGLVAGRISDGSGTFTAGQMLGILLTGTSAAGQWAKLLIDHR